MRKLRIAFLLFALFLGLSSHAQVDNYCLRFSSDEGIVNLGRLTGLKSTQNYTLQMWICPSQWTPGASLLRCGRFSIKLGNSHSLLINDGDEHLFVNSNLLDTNLWTHLTLRVGTSETKAYINGSLVGTLPTHLVLPSDNYSLWLGGEYRGRIDEVRVWRNALPEQNAGYWRTTLNSTNPSWPNLVAYWKMDQEQCPNLVDYKSRYHGTLSPSGVAKEKVTDNVLFRYLINLAYGNIERYFDRAIDAQHYWLSNRISIIGAVAENSDVRLYLDRDDATPQAGAAYLDTYAKRSGVLSLPTAAAHLSVPGHTLKGMGNYTVETWVYVDEWQEGAYIFRYENADATQGISLRLGSVENLELILRYNGHDYSYSRVAKNGAWFHVGFSGNFTATKANAAFFFVVNGSSKTATTAPTEILQPSMPSLDGPITLGEGLVGKLDETILFSSTRSTSQMGEDSKELPLPGADRTMPVEQYYSMRALYHYDLPEEVGFDAFSVQGFFDKMRSYTEGMRGVKFTLTVASNDFDNYLGNATTRTKLAKKMAEWGNDDHFDGIDLDFEWVYTAAKWRNIGLLCQEIRSHLKEGKILSVSPHKVAYAFPTDLMKYVDYFNFQCYGPGDQGLCKPDGFTNAASLFVNHGYPKDKIILSYSTTTTSGYVNGSRDASLSPQGYRYLYPGEDKYDPSLNYLHNSNTNADYWMAGYDQVLWRNQWVVENDFGGMMYWDLGNDLPASSKHSLARATTYWLNSNVEKLVTSVTNPAPAPADDTTPPIATEDPEEIIKESVTLTSLSEVENTMAYTITNAKGLGTIYSNPTEEKLWLGASSNANFGQAVDLGSLAAQWLLIRYKDNYYLYNLERQQFLIVAKFNVTSQPCTFSAEATPVEVTERGGLFSFRTYTDEERGYMCASPQLKNQGNPVCQWTIDDDGALWQLTTAPNVDTKASLQHALSLIDPEGVSTTMVRSTLRPTYDLSGRRITSPTRGIYLQRGHKIIKN